MILLLNKEVVASEILELAKFKISSTLKIPVDEISARWEMDDGKVVPAFDIDISKIKNLKEDHVKQTLGAIWRWLRGDLKIRLEGIKKIRG